MQVKYTLYSNATLSREFTSHNFIVVVPTASANDEPETVRFLGLRF